MHTILIVDDNERIRDLYGKNFSREGYRVLQASCADEANEILLIEKVDLMLLDINMPSVDGAVFHLVTRMFHPDIKIIISSVYPLDDQKSLIKGATDYFDKSESLRILVQKVKAALVVNSI